MNAWKKITKSLEKNVKKTEGNNYVRFMSNQLF